MLRARDRACRLARAVAVVACVTALAGAAAPDGTAAVARTVATGSPLSLGEPQVAASSRVSGVAATTFTFSSRPATSASAAALVRVWARPAGTRQWADAGRVLPAGFAASYDPAVAASPGGSLLVAVGTAPQAGGCITGGSVAFTRVAADGRLGPVRLVSDQRGTSQFDDRPAIAAGRGGTVWVAWSEGSDADACRSVGTGDRLMVAVSHDGGSSFAAPVTLPADGGTAAFGARLVPLGNGRVAIAWTESMSAGQQAALLAVLGPTGLVLPPQPVLTGAAPPRVLPRASFYDFPSVSIAALPGGRLAIAEPLWRDARSVIGLAAGKPGGPWRTGTVIPPAGADLLLPALGVLPSGAVRLLCAVHWRAGDRLGYSAARIRVSSRGAPVSPAGLRPVTTAPAGPGFFEIGEELSITPAPAGLISAIVLAGHSGAVLETESWTAPRPASSPAGTTGSAVPDPRAAQPGGNQGWPVALLAAIVLIACSAAAVAWALRAIRGSIRGPGR